MLIGNSEGPVVKHLLLRAGSRHSEQFILNVGIVLQPFAKKHSFYDPPPPPNPVIWASVVSLLFDLFPLREGTVRSACFLPWLPTGAEAFPGSACSWAIHIQHGQPLPSLHSVTCVLIILPSAA